MDINTLNEMLGKAPVNEDSGFKPIMARLELADGENVSVQTGRTHYCSPRGNYGPWKQVEVMCAMQDDYSRNPVCIIAATKNVP